MDDFSLRYSQASDKLHYVRIAGCYQLVEDYIIQTDLFPRESAYYERIHLLTDGRLLIMSGYCWDGASGPVIDRKENMRAGCGHDAIYQLMRMGLLPFAYWRAADSEYCRWAREDGSWPITVKIDRIGLGIVKGKYAHPDSRRKVYKAR